MTLSILSLPDPLCTKVLQQVSSHFCVGVADRVEARGASMVSGAEDAKLSAVTIMLLASH